MQEQEIMVSVYCLTYNHEKYIRNALEGFVSQKTNFPFEVFVHDDASTDGTASIIREYAEKYPHIIKPIYQTVNQYSQGISISRTHIIPHMRGKYVAVCEGDDYWCDPEKLQRQVDFLENAPEYVACVHNTKKLDLTSGKESLLFGNEAYTITLEDTIAYGSSAYQTSSLLYRAEYAHNRPEFIYKVKTLGDYPFAIFLSLMGKIYYMPQVMSVYRANVPGSWTDRVGSEPKKLIPVMESTITMLQMADEFSNGEHHALFTKIRQRYEYKLLKVQRDFLKVIKHPLYKSEAASAKIKYVVLACFPWLLDITAYQRQRKRNQNTKNK